MHSNGKTSSNKKEKLVKRADAACSPTRPRDHDKDILRWPVFLPSGDQREVQINDISPANPMYGYSPVPRAGTMYGLDVSHHRVEYMQKLVINYIPFIKALLASDKPMLWHSTIFPNDENGYKLLEFEYRNLGKFYEFNKEVSANPKRNSSVIKFNPQLCFNKYSPTQLIFGVVEEEHNWIREDLDLDSGRLDGISQCETSYLTWIGLGPKNLYREYRFNERWAFCPYSYEYHTAADDLRCANEFFDYVLANSVEYKKEWQLVRKCSGRFNSHVFGICNICPRKFMHLFEEYNFTNKKPWHRYWSLFKHANTPRNVKTIKIPYFEDDLKPNFQAAVRDCVKRIRRDDAGIAVKQFSKYTPRITMQNQSNSVLSNYYNVLEICNLKQLNIRDHHHVNTIPDFIEYSRDLSIMTTGNERTPALHSEQASDYYVILCKIDLIASSLETRGVNISDKLKAIFNECNLMRERFVFVVNIFSYRNGIPETQAKSMLAKTLITCCDHKIELSVFEQRMVKIVNLATSKMGTHVLVKNFQDNFRTIINSPKCDSSFPTRELSKTMLRNARKLKQMFSEVKSTTMAMGHGELMFVNVI